MDHKPYFVKEKIQPDQEEDIRLLNMAAIDFGNAVKSLVPPSADQRECIRLLRQLVYFGEAAIRLRGDA